MDEHNQTTTEVPPTDREDAEDVDKPGRKYFNPKRDKPLFPHGIVNITPGALAALQNWATANAASLSFTFSAMLTAHVYGDFGELDAEDVETNMHAIKHGDRVMSAYLLPDTNVKIWVITDAGHRVTTFLLPEEY